LFDQQNVVRIIVAARHNVVYQGVIAARRVPVDEN
jgi:hypothetical protein